MRDVEVRVVAPGDGQDVQPLEEHELQDDREPERRHRDPDHRRDPREDVGRATSPARRREPRGDPEREREHHRHRDELDRCRRATGDVLEHGAPRPQGLAPVARRDADQVARDLRRERPVEAEVLARRLELLGSRAGPCPCRRGIAGDDARDDERQHDDPDDDQRGEREPPQDEPGHAAGVSS
jgi:hypothetical protein